MGETFGRRRALGPAAVGYCRYARSGTNGILAAPRSVADVSTSFDMGSAGGSSAFGRGESGNAGVAAGRRPIAGSGEDAANHRDGKAHGHADAGTELG